MTELKDRVVEARLAAGYDIPKQWAEALGVSPSAVYQLEEGKTRSLSIKTAGPMARLSGFSLEWLQHGKGPKFVASRVGEERSAYLTIPVHSAHVSAGHGAKNGEVTEIGSLLFRPRSLSKRDISESAAQVWYVTGNSMFPRLREGDAVLFDCNDRDPVDGKLYVIEWGKDKQTYVKRLYHELDGAIRVVSDNPAPEFRDRIVQPGDAGFRVLGRVRWIGSWED
jgi:phage repressor protein C with HTH and peptisase S24 domain